MTSTKKYFSLSMLFFVAAVTAYVVLAILLSRQQVALENTLTKIAEQKSLDNQFASLSEVVTESEVDRGYLAGRVIDGQAGVVEFLSEIDQLARAFGVTLETSELKAEKDEKAPLGNLAVSVQVSGGVEAVNRVMYALELLPYAKEFTSYRISHTGSSGGDAASGMVTMRIIMK